MSPGQQNLRPRAPCPRRRRRPPWRHRQPGCSAWWTSVSPARPGSPHMPDTRILPERIVADLRLDALLLAAVTVLGVTAASLRLPPPPPAARRPGRQTSDEEL